MVTIFSRPPDKGGASDASGGVHSCSDQTRTCENQTPRSPSAHDPLNRGSRRGLGFTLIELLLALLLIALLASLAVPVVSGGITRARESTLRADLYAMRKAIDDFHADNGAYPKELDELVSKRYLRRIPPDPVTERRDSWVIVRAEADKGEKGGGIFDVRSGSPDQATDGSYFKDW